MLTYQYVEDYLESLAGYDPNNYAGLLFPGTPQISLARYDVNIVDSMANHTVLGSALTDRQAELAVKLILKYRKQFAKLNVDVSPVENPKFRLPTRKIDRTKAIWPDDGFVGVRFPYDRGLIDSIRDQSKNSSGSAKFDHENKIWKFGVTEDNINWLVTWGEINGFEIDQVIKDMFASILVCEAIPYEIKLIKTDDVFVITNAAESLINYINEKLGGFALSNATRLVDHAGVLGYQVDEQIERPMLVDAFVNRVSYVSVDQDNFKLLLEYAEISNRYPICIYNPGLVDLDLSAFAEDDIVRFDRNGKTKTSNYDPYGVKVVYAQKIPNTWDFPVPLLVTTFDMMHGGRKLDWLSRAEKIIYYGVKQLRNN